MPAGLKNKGFLNPEECWKDWHIHEGSLRKIQEKMLREGRTNPKTGNPPTKSGIEKAAFTWALENQDEARKDLEYAWEKEGVILTDEAWKQFLVSAAKLVHHQRPGRYERFLIQNGLLEYA